MLRQLLPKGRAFQAFFGTDWYNFIDGLSQEPSRIADFYEDVRNSGIPGLIPSDALSDWETFLNLTEIPTLTDAERNDRIKSKISQVGGGGPDYLEEILETEFDEDFEIIENLSSLLNPFTGATMGNPEMTCGSGATCTPIYPNGILIAGPPTYINGTTEIEFVLPPDITLWPLIWFITGPLGYGDFVDLPADREDDFIKTVLALKPAHTWAIAQVNFI